MVDLNVPLLMPEILHLQLVAQTLKNALPSHLALPRLTEGIPAYTSIPKIAAIGSNRHVELHCYSSRPKTTRRTVKVSIATMADV